MPVTALNTTTLTSAIDDKTTSLLVGSNTNHVVGEFIVVGKEMMLVQSKVGTTYTNVERGQNGTQATGHVALCTVYGSASGQLVVALKDGLGGTRVQLGDSQPVGMPNYFLPLGQRVRDELGNEYVLCDFTATVYPKQPVGIDSNFAAAPLGVTGRGNIGVVAETVACTSDNWGWVQVYGRCKVLLGMSGATPSDAANGPTTLSTSAQTRFMLATSLTSPNGIGWTSETSTNGYIIDGMVVATDASPGDVSSVTSQTGHTGSEIAVFLNYPKIYYNEPA